MSLKKKLDNIIKKFYELRDILSSGEALSTQDFAKFSKEYADLEDVAQASEEYNNCLKQLSELEEMLKDPSLDKEIKNLVEADQYSLKDKKNIIEETIKLLLLPKDKDDGRNVILEVRAGTGGEEAGLFAAELFRLYNRYATLKGWTFEVLASNDNGIGAIKEATALITGKGPFARLKFESGVHRVQRVPQTESGGRVHTSAATVAVLPEAEDVDIVIDEKDLQIDVYRASGAGGQHVNTTDSAVRITHIPTGVVVACQDERSQHKNKARAMKVLRSRIYDAERQRLEKERSQNRRTQVGSGDRSERIRTYNFPQGRVSDHRINLTLYKIAQIMEGEALDEIIDALTAHDQAEKIANSQE